MRTRFRRAVAAVVVVAGLAAPALTAGTALAQPAYAPVPPPRAEIVPPPPGSRYVWIGGHWQWNGVRYVWDRGRYVLRPVAYSAWVPAHWARRGGGWVWVPGHWR